MTKSSALHWYVGLVKPYQERKCAEALTKLGVAHYLPVQREKRKYSDRVKEVERLILPRMIFVRTGEARRIQLLSDVYGLYAFMNDGGPYHPAIVPDRELDEFRFMVEHSEGKVEISSQPFAPGDRVKVIAGPLKGLECELTSVGEKRCMAVRIGRVGTAFLTFSPSDLALLEMTEEKA